MSDLDPEVEKMLVMADSLLSLALYRHEATERIWQDEATTLIGQIRTRLKGES